MKTGSSLQELARELERQQDQKRDFLAPSRELKMEVTEDGHENIPAHVHLRVNGHGAFPLGDTAHEQVATRVGIPQRYYDRMKAAAPHLLASNVNHWFRAEPEKRMVRTLDGQARAFLSERYRPLDNLDLAQAVLPVLSELGVKVESAELTAKRLYVQATTEKVQAEVRPGDVVRAGIIVSNSEIGLGSVKVEPMVYRLVCSNGMIATDHSLRKYHVGRSGSEGDFAAEFFQDDTRRADDKAFWMKVRDVVKGAFNLDAFSTLVNGMRSAAERKMDADPVGVVELVRRQHQLNDGERSGVLTHLIQGGDLSQYGLLNAVTRTAEDVDSYDRAIELERLGGTLLDIDDRGWKNLLAASKNLPRG